MPSETEAWSRRTKIALTRNQKAASAIDTYHLTPLAFGVAYRGRSRMLRIFLVLSLAVSLAGVAFSFVLKDKVPCAVRA